MFNAFMKVGHDRLRRGSLEDAALAFEEAVAHAESADDKASALQMRGIAERLLGELEASRETLEYALATAKDLVLRARITRDLGMTYLDLKQYALAAASFHSSHAVLFDHNELVEASMSNSFLGRVMLLVGRRREAVKLMSDADKVLCGGPNRDYELNNLIWLMRASCLRRFISLSRARRLIRQTGQSRRNKELAVIVIGGDRLYRLLRKYG